MKQLLIFLCCIACYNIDIAAQSIDISGRYMLDEYYRHIEIKDSNFFYIEDRAEHRPIPDTLAICTWEWVDKNFIKIKSKSPQERALSTMEVTQAVDNSLQDSIEVVFQLPYNNTLLVRILVDYFKSYEFVYTKRNNRIKLPLDTEEITFEIFPDTHIEQTFGKFYGVVAFSNIFKVIYIEKGMNHVNINLPAIDDYFFERYYVVEEFILIKDDCIHWNGQTFKKQ